MEMNYYAYIFKLQDLSSNTQWMEGVFVVDQAPNFFVDPYTTIPVKIFAAFCYAWVIMASLAILAFVVYETQGLAGPYRTVINQLGSCVNFLVVNYMIWAVGIDLIRVIFGPLPFAVCIFNVIMKNTFLMMVIFILLAILSFKYMLLIVWKTMKPMNDSLITALITINSFAVSLILSATKAISPGEPLFYTCTCTGVYQPALTTEAAAAGGKKMPFFGVTAVSALLAYLVILTRLYFKKQNAVLPMDNQAQQPKSLESLILNLINMVLLAIAGFSTLRMNQIKPDQLLESPNWQQQIFNYFGNPVLFSTSIAIKILVKNGRDIQRELFKN